MCGAPGTVPEYLHVKTPLIRLMCLTRRIQFFVISVVMKQFRPEGLCSVAAYNKAYTPDDEYKYYSYTLYMSCDISVSIYIAPF